MVAHIGRSGLLLFTVTIVALHLLSPEFDPISQGISYYALGKFGWVFTASLLFIGVGSLTVVVLLWPKCLTTWGRIGLSLLVVWTLMLEAGAFFEMDTPGASPTVSGRIHSIAGTSFLLLPPAALLIARSVSRLQPLSPRSRCAWILAWCVVATSGLLITFNGFMLGLGVGGLVQRAYWLTIVIWLFSLAQMDSHMSPDAANQPMVV